MEITVQVQYSLSNFRHADLCFALTGRNWPIWHSNRGMPWVVAHWKWSRTGVAARVLLTCEEADIKTFVPKTITSNDRALGRYDKRDFIYIKQDNEYRCPAGKRLKFRHPSRELKINVYCTSACPGCELKKQCTTAKERRVRRWEHEDILDAAQDRLDSSPWKLIQRRCTVEHVFGTLKFWMGPMHFLMKMLKHLGAEMSLKVLAYNLRSVVNILEVEGTMKAISLVEA